VTTSPSTLSIDGREPASRVRPASAEELATALASADRERQTVAPVGGGTQLDLGMPPSRLDLVIETTGLNRLVEYEPADLTVTVEAGMRFGDLQRLLGEQGQFLALDPPVQEQATIGGVIATNMSGPLRFSYGTPRDLVIGTRVANPDGTLTRAGGRVVKNVAGYDLNKLYIGSLGTLAIIVELSFKLAPLPPATANVVGDFASAGHARAVISTVVRSPLSPLAIELVGSRRVMFRVGGYPEAVQRQVGELSALIEAQAGSVVDAESSAWGELARSRAQARAEREAVVKAAAPLSSSVALVELLERRLAGLEPMVWAHAGNGVAYAACNAPAHPEVLIEARREVQALGVNASLVIERCPTALKRGVDVWGDPGAAVGVMRALKAKLDPNGTLNPGRYVGGI
jgi:glycolate oxidase FAD binding subunit